MKSCIRQAVRQVVFTAVLTVSRLDVDGQSFAPIGLLKTDAASDWLLIKRHCIGTKVGLEISDKKIIPRKTEQTEQMVISDGIPAVPRNRNSRNSVPNPSAEEKTVRNSVPLNKNISKLSEFPSKPFSERENNSEFRSVVPN